MVTKISEKNDLDERGNINCLCAAIASRGHCPTSAGRGTESPGVTPVIASVTVSRRWKWGDQQLHGGSEIRGLFPEQTSILQPSNSWLFRQDTDMGSGLRRDDTA